MCVDGMNGRCIGIIHRPDCVCTYDTCADDADCPDDETCACHGSPFIGDGVGNTCVKGGNCRVDTDCGAKGYCSPSSNSLCSRNLTGYYCHTARDLCVDDADCPAQVNAIPACVYSTRTSRWECVQVPLCT